MAAARVTSKGQITIPKAVRERLGLRPGDEVEFVEERGIVRLQRRLGESPFRCHRGYLAHLAGQGPDELLQQMRGE